MSTSMPGIISNPCGTTDPHEPCSPRSHLYRLLPVALGVALWSAPALASPVAHARCTVEQSPARIASPMYPEYPALAKLQGLSGTSTVRVDLSETGAVRRSALQTSSGSGILDRAAVAAATSVTFAPETRNCENVAGSYAIDVTFE